MCRMLFNRRFSFRKAPHVADDIKSAWSTWHHITPRNKVRVCLALSNTLTTKPMPFSKYSITLIHAQLPKIAVPDFLAIWDMQMEVQEGPWYFPGEQGKKDVWKTLLVSINHGWPNLLNLEATYDELERRLRATLFKRLLNDVYLYRHFPISAGIQMEAI